MIFAAISISVPIATYFGLPWLLTRLGAKQTAPSWILVVAGVVFFASWYLPSPLINGQQTAATTHFVGGGIFTSFVWLYSKQAFGWKSHWAVELLSLMAFVSLLGVANELFELIAVQAGIVHIPLTDTSWDLLMNTLGAFSFWSLYQVIGRSKR